MNSSVIVKQSGTGNIANVATHMSGVTNYVIDALAKSSMPEDVKSHVKQLTAQIGEIAPAIDPRQMKRMTADVQTLSNEMAQEEPRRGTFEVSLKGLKEAAEAVGEIALPVLATVRKLMPLLLGA